VKKARNSPSSRFFNSQSIKISKNRQKMPEKRQIWSQIFISTKKRRKKFVYYNRNQPLGIKIDVFLFLWLFYVTNFSKNET
jgi:hypothetical protein